MKMQLDEMNKSVNDNSNILTSFAKQNNENEIDENQLSLIEEISQKESLDIIDETKIDELIKKEEDKLNVLSDIIDEDISDKDRENYLEEEFEKINQSELLNQSKLFDE